MMLQGPENQRRKRLAWRAGMPIVLGSLLASGCSLMKPKGPVDANVLEGRQLTQQGISALQRGQLDRAEKLFTDAMQVSPSDESCRRHLAESFWKHGQHDKAIALMDEAIKLSGGDPKTLVQSGEMYLARGNLAVAARRADDALAASPQLACAWVLKADVLQKQGNLTDALAGYHRALSLENQPARVQLAIAEIYRQQGRPQRSLSTLTALAQTYQPNQQPAELLHLQGLAYQSLGRYDDAVSALTLASRQGKPSADLLVSLAEAELLAGRPNDAAITARHALELQPAHEAGGAMLARIESSQRGMSAANRR